MMSNSAPVNGEFSPVAIENEMERILNSRKFLVAGQLGRFLRFVVEETLAGRQDEIKQYTVGVKALGRDRSFNPQADPMVRMQAHRLRRALHRYYENDGVNDPIRIEIPKGRYVPIFIPNQSPAPDLHTKPLDSKQVRQDSLSASFTSYPSVAVLPFSYIGKDQEDVFIANGLTEEIVIALTRFSDFLVVGPLNKEKIEKQHLGPRGIGQEYEVRFILDGTVRKQGEILRTMVKLTDSTTGQHLWGDTLNYNLDLTSILEMENQIVAEVVSTIADNFGIIPRTLGQELQGRQPESLSDYEAVLRFYHYAAVLTEDAYVGAMNALQQAVANDSTYAMAPALLGDLMASAYHLGLEDSPAVLEQAEKLGRKAVALDPNCQSARFTMALISFLRFQREACLETCKQTLKLNPNHANYIAAPALLLAMMGEWKQGLTLIQKAMRLNPHHPGWYFIIPFMDAYRRGEYAVALIEARRFNTPDYFWDPLIRTAVYAQLNRQEEAQEAAAELFALVPDFGQRGYSLIRRMVFSEENTAILLDGLRKASVDVGT